MPLTEVKGSLVVLRVKEPTEVDWLNLVCLENSSFEITNEVTTRRTNCGVIKSISDPDFNASGTAVQNATPTSVEASYAQVKAWQVARTKLHFQYISLADVAAGLTEGEGVNNYGLGYFTSTTLSAAAEGAEGTLSFDFTMEGTGNLDDFDES